MKVGVYRPFFHGLLCCLGIAHLTAGGALTVFPSNDVEVNQSVTMRCEINPFPPFFAIFNVTSPFFSSVRCTLERSNGVCKNTTDSCQFWFDASCPSDTQYSIQVTVSRKWNGASVYCESPYNRSNRVNFTVRVSVTSVTLTPTPIALIAGQQMNLTCTTSYSNPPAIITWIKSSLNVTAQSTSTTDTSEGLVRTVSLLKSIVVKEDNGKQVYCEASNTPYKSVTSSIQTLNIMYKPEVRSSQPSPYSVIEGQEATLTCTIIDANPNTIIWRWFQTDSPNTVLYSGPSYTITNIRREKSGSYSCTASNIVGTSEAATVNVNVQYKPEVNSGSQSSYRVNEEQEATLICAVIDANPNTSITWRWFKRDSPNTVLHSGPSYVIPRIRREKSGSYSCTASNSVGTSEPATIIVDVLYKPEVKRSSPSPYKVREGQTAQLECVLSAANPYISISWKWFSTDNPRVVLNNSSTYKISNITREKSGSYRCTAANSVGEAEAATIEVDVQYIPSIEEQAMVVVNEYERVVLTRDIRSNPLANVSWYDGTKHLKSEFSVNTTSIAIQKAECADTKNFTLVASNALQLNVTSRVELIVNCKPMSDVSNITLAVSDGTQFAFSTTVIAYPKPRYELLFENGTKYSGIINSMTVNAVNNFTIHFKTACDENINFGTYHLNIYNKFGETTVYVNVLTQRRPSSPRISHAICYTNSATIWWISSYDGGISQTFVTLAFIDQQEVGRSGTVCDNGETEPRKIQLQSLQPSTKYVFRVVAQNKKGNSSSEGIQCKTTEEIGNNTPVVAGSVGGTLALITLIFITVFLVQRRYTCLCIIKFEKKKSGKTMKENKETSPYTTMTGQEHTERNVYDELTQNENVNQYEAMLIKESQANDANVYEKLQKIDDIDNSVPGSDQKNILQTEGSSKQLPHMTETTSEYMNTSFVE